MGISTVLAVVITIALLTFVSWRARSTNAQGRLRYGPFLRIFGWLMVLSTSGLLYVLLFTDHGGQGVPLSLLVVTFGLGGAYLLAEGYRTRGTFDANGIVFETLWSGQKVQTWVDLTSVEFNAVMMWYVLTFRDGTKIRLSNLLIGHKEVLSQVEGKR